MMNLDLVIPEIFLSLSIMFLLMVGVFKKKSENLVSTTYQAMMEGISIVKNNINLGDIGFAIQKYAEQKGFSIVKDFCGHGIGKIFHQPPNILH